MTADSSKTPEEVLERTAAVLRVLGHADRLRLLEALGADRRLAVGELAERLHLAPNAVSQHLNLMLARRIVRKRRLGRRVHYEIDSAIARNLLRCLRRAGGEE